MRAIFRIPSEATAILLYVRVCADMCACTCVKRSSELSVNQSVIKQYCARMCLLPASSRPVSLPNVPNISQEFADTNCLLYSLSLTVQTNSSFDVGGMDIAWASYVFVFVNICLKFVFFVIMYNAGV